MAFALHYFQSPCVQYSLLMLRMSFVCCCYSLPEFAPPLPWFSTTIEKFQSVQDKKLSVCKMIYFCLSRPRSKEQTWVLVSLFLSVPENWLPVGNMPVQGIVSGGKKRVKGIWRIKSLTAWSHESSIPIPTLVKGILLDLRHSAGHRMGQGIGTCWHLLRWNINIPVSGQRPS